MSGTLSNALEQKYLESKTNKTHDELVRLIRIRLSADDTDDDAELMIAYREAGIFRRVLLDRITGAELLMLLSPSPDEIIRWIRSESTIFPRDASESIDVVERAVRALEKRA